MDGWLLRRYVSLCRMVYIGLNTLACPIFKNGFIGDKWDVGLVQDVDGTNKGTHKLVVDHLKSNGDLKSLPEIVRELENTAQQQVQNLKEVVIEKDDRLKVTHQKNWSLTNKVDYVTAQREQAEREKVQLIEDHKKGRVVFLYFN